LQRVKTPCAGALKPVAQVVLARNVEDVEAIHRALFEDFAESRESN
jgi:hypothetical protein